MLCFIAWLASLHHQDSLVFGLAAAINGHLSCTISGHDLGVVFSFISIYLISDYVLYYFNASQGFHINLKATTQL